MARSHDLLEALVGSTLVRAPGVQIAGVTTGAGAPTWDAVAAADCPGLTGDRVTFTVLEDRTIVVADDLPDGVLDPLAEALEETVTLPYRVAAARTEGTLWTGVAESFRPVELPGVTGDAVELSVVGGRRELMIDGEASDASIGPLDELAADQGDVAISAERVDGDLFAVDVFPL